MIKLSDELHIPTMREVMAERQRLANEAKPARALKRHFAAGRVNRQNADWTTQPYTSNWLSYRYGRTMRARAREMAANAPHFAKFLLLAVGNVVGSQGIQLQCRAEISDRLHTTLNKKVEMAFWEWSFAENCSVTGKLDWVGQQKLAVKTLIRDGEVLIRLYRSGPFGLQLKFVNVDYLDETFTETLPNGNRVIMSVEVDAADRPVAYWLTTPASDINFTRTRTRTRERVPAEDIIHITVNTDDETQVRGLTWFAASLMTGRNLAEYDNGVLTSMKLTSFAAGFIKKDIPDTEPGWEGGEDDEGWPRRPEMDLAPGSIFELDPGEEFQQFDPKQPTQNHREVTEKFIADIAAGLGVNYFELQGDMASVNFSSARVGLAESRDMWKGLQILVINNLCRRVFHEWLSAAMVSDRLDLSPREYELVRNPEWQARSWEYIEPLKDINATVEGLKTGIMSYTRVLSERGIDPEDHFKTIQKDRQLAAKYDVDLKEMLDPKPAPAVAQSKPEENEDDDPPPAKRSYTNGHAEAVN
jgi:lambda family phage portal protein